MRASKKRWVLQTVPKETVCASPASEGLSEVRRDADGHVLLFVSFSNVGLCKFDAKGLIF